MTMCSRRHVFMPDGILNYGQKYWRLSIQGAAGKRKPCPGGGYPKRLHASSEGHGEAITLAEPTRERCQWRLPTFTQYHRSNSSWYAHKAPDGSWCREK